MIRLSSEITPIPCITTTNSILFFPLFFHTNILLLVLCIISSVLLHVYFGRKRNLLLLLFLCLIIFLTSKFKIIVMVQGHYLQIPKHFIIGQTTYSHPRFGVLSILTCKVLKTKIPTYLDCCWRRRKNTKKNSYFSNLRGRGRIITF